MKRSRLVAAGWALLLVAGGAAGAPAQDLAGRVAAAAGGDVHFEVAARPGVRICEDGDLRMGDSDGDGWVRDERRCHTGPFTVILEREGGGQARALRLRPRGEGSGTDLGVVDPRAALEYFFALARDPGSRDGRRELVQRALMATTLLADVDPAPDLLDVARDQALSGDTRKSALFWVGQVASSRVGEHLAGIAAREAEDQEIRDAAVFALSQRPAPEALPALMDLAREAPHVETRRRAMFWLAQLDDPRVTEFFADLILRGPLGG